MENRADAFAAFAAQDTLNKLNRVRGTEGDSVWANRLGRVAFNEVLLTRFTPGLSSKTLDLLGPSIQEVIKAELYQEFLKGIQERLELERKGYGLPEYDKFMAF